MANHEHPILYYEKMGAGEPMIMLHGNSQSHKVFSEYAAYFKQFYEVILPDNRGHGKSLGPGWIPFAARTRFFTISDMAKDVCRLMDYLGIRQAIFLGFSDGANIALEMAARWPQRVRAVIAVSGNAAPGGLRAPVRLGISLWYGVLTLLERILSFPRLSQARQLAWLLLHSPQLTAKMLHSIAAPVLLLAGTWDLIRTRHTRWMASCIPNSKLVLIKGGTHLLFLRKKEQYLPAICRFLQTL